MAPEPTKQAPVHRAKTGAYGPEGDPGLFPWVPRAGRHLTILQGTLIYLAVMLVLVLVTLLLQWQRTFGGLL